jgi:hypothetical protein
MRAVSDAGSWRFFNVVSPGTCRLGLGYSFDLFGRLTPTVEADPIWVGSLAELIAT